jgi:hypothetical protein
MQHEEEEIIEQFFVWKAGTFKWPELQEKIWKVQHIVFEQMWTLDDLKAMSDTSSLIYEMAIQLGILDGIAQSF